MRQILSLAFLPQQNTTSPNASNPFSRVTATKDNKNNNTQCLKSCLWPSATKKNNTQFANSSILSPSFIQVGCKHHHQFILFLLFLILFLFYFFFALPGAQKSLQQNKFILLV
jgi:amino acid transporter